MSIIERNESARPGTRPILPLLTLTTVEFDLAQASPVVTLLLSTESGSTCAMNLRKLLGMAHCVTGLDRLAALIDGGNLTLHGDDANAWKQWESEHERTAAH